MYRHLTKAGLVVGAALFLASAASAQAPKIIAAASNQPSDGITERDMDQGFLYNFQEYAKEIFLAKLRQRIEAMGKQLPANFDVPTESFYITTGGKKLAATRFNVSGVTNSVEVLGITGDTLHRIGCTHQSKDKVPLSYGACADKLKEIFGVDLNTGFNVEHLKRTQAPAHP